MYYKSGDDEQVYVFRLVDDTTTKRLTTHSNILPVSPVGAENTDEIPSEISGQFAMPYKIQSTVCIR